MTLNKKSISLLLLLLCAFIAVKSFEGQKSSVPRKSLNFQFEKPCTLSDTSYFVNFNNHPVQIKIICPSKQIKGVLLLLPGWNYPDLDWITKTSVAKTALNNQFALLLVEMGKSVYMDSFYPDMRKDYKTYPTRTWLFDSVLSPLNKFGWFTKNSNSFALGLSTGARGAVILGLEHAEYFKGVAGLSGDYNPLLDKNDGLMVNCLGKYEKNAFRWSGTNNISLRAKEFKTNIFLAHGTKDQIVPFNQTINLLEKLLNIDFLLTSHPKYSNEGVFIGNYTLDNSKSKKIRFVSVKNANHDYQFWNKSGLMALDFFNTLQNLSD